MESQPCRTRILITSSSCRAMEIMEQLFGGPSAPIAATSPELRGKLCSCLCLERTHGACLFLLLDVGFWGRAPRPCLGRSSGLGAVLSAFLLAHRGCLIYCSLLGNWEGGELAFLGVGHGCCSPFLPKRSAFPLRPFLGSLGGGRLSLEAGWSFGSLGVRLGFKENL